MQMETLSRQLYRFMDDLIDTALCNLYGAQAHSSLFFCQYFWSSHEEWVINWLHDVNAVTNFEKRNGLDNLG